MNSIKNYAELKASAREHMIGGYGNLILISFFYMLAGAFVISVAPGFAGAKSPVDFIIVISLSLLLNAFVQMMQAGLYHAYIKQCCAIRPKASDVFSAFSGEIGKTAFGVSLIVIIIQNVCMVPFEVYLYMHDLKQIEEVLILAALAAAGMLLFYVINLGFSQCALLIFDFPNKSVKEIIALSFWMMKGQKLRYVGLVCSFIPLIIVAILTFGIGMIWVIPYMYATKCCFYLNLVSSKSKSET